MVEPTYSELVTFFGERFGASQGVTEDVIDEFLLQYQVRIRPEHVGDVHDWLVVDLAEEKVAKDFQKKSEAVHYCQQQTGTTRGTTKLSNGLHGYKLSEEDTRYSFTIGRVAQFINAGLEEMIEDYKQRKQEQAAQDQWEPEQEQEITQ